MATNLATLVIETIGKSGSFQASLKADEAALKDFVRKVVKSERDVANAQKRVAGITQKLFTQDIPDPFQTLRSGIDAINLQQKAGASPEALKKARAELTKLVQLDQQIASAGGLAEFNRKAAAEAQALTEEEKRVASALSIVAKERARLQEGGNLLKPSELTVMDQFNIKWRTFLGFQEQGIITAQEYRVLYIGLRNELDKVLLKQQQVAQAGGQRAFDFKQGFAKQQVDNAASAAVRTLTTELNNLPTNKAALLSQKFRELRAITTTADKQTRAYSNSIFALARTATTVEEVRVFWRFLAQETAKNTELLKAYKAEQAGLNADIAKNTTVTTPPVLNIPLAPAGLESLLQYEAAVDSLQTDMRNLNTELDAGTINQEQYARGSSTLADRAQELAIAERDYGKDLGRTRTELGRQTAEQARSAQESQQFLRTLNNTGPLARFRARLAEINRELQKTNPVITRSRGLFLKFGAGFDLIQQFRFFLLKVIKFNCQNPSLFFSCSIDV